MPSQIFWNYNETYLKVGHFTYQISYEGATPSSASLVGYDLTCPLDLEDIEAHYCLKDEDESGNIKSDWTLPSSVTVDEHTIPVISIVFM